MTLSNYLLVGWLFYVIVAAIRWRTFRDATTAGVMRGLAIGVFLWPILLTATVWLFWGNWASLKDYKK